MQKNVKTLAKILTRCADFFTLRTHTIQLLKEISVRENIFQQLKSFVGTLDIRTDAKLLDNVKSKKSIQLLNYSRELETATLSVCALIDKFMKQNKRYYGSIFCFDGTDYVKSALKEIDEIKNIVRAVRGDEEFNQMNDEASKKVSINADV